MSIAARQPPRAGHRARRVGLLGGSFNPAHDGHRHISIEALRRLDLDEIWWLVSPQNPLKPTAGMAPLAARIADAQAMARHPRIKVTDIEARLGTRYTVDTLRQLRRRHCDHRFVWLIGADNLIQIPRWKAWQEIFHMATVAVFARPSYSLKALAGRAAIQFATARISEGQARCLVRQKPPAWVFIRNRLHPASSTSIRAGRAKAAQPVD